MSHAWMPLYVADYLGDTGELSTLEHGAYILLIMHYWQKRGLPDDDDKLARICRLDNKSFAKAKLTLRSFFGECWSHSRIDAELVLADEKHKKRSEAGKRGGRPKLSTTNDKAMLTEIESQAEARPNQPPSPSPSKSSEANASAQGPQNSVPFDARSDLFANGVADLMAVTGKTSDGCKSLIGKWLKSVEDDAGKLRRVIADAKRDRRADAVAWITAAVKPSKHGENWRERPEMQGVL